MSKRLNKRQQRELEELEQLKAQEKSLVQPEEEEEIEGDDDEAEEVSSAVAAAPVNPFAALGGEEEVAEEESDEAEPEETLVKKTKKKKPKKKKKSAAATPALIDEDAEAGASSLSTPAKGKRKNKKNAPEEEMDEVDRALAELNMTSNASGSRKGEQNEAGPSETRQMMKFRSLLSVDPKNLDADAELRRFFGSKVVASSAQSHSRNHRPGPAKLRYTISKPKPTYPPATSLAGLAMREMKAEEVEDLYERRGWDEESLGGGEKWYTFEHSGQWRETQRQFMGAVRSHDPNELMALLQVYPWHVDTLLQVSEVYRLQSDIGAASDFAERALYAFDRCLMPSFNVSSGTCRLDFDRVENRSMFTALHRIISYLGRRGCWLTAFNFAKLLFSLDPMGDPHGASFWLDFLAVKSGNGEWLISMLEQAVHSPSVVAWHAYPGMAYAQALALRQDESSKKHGDHSESDAALQEAIRKFPQVVIPLADKIGADLPSDVRSHPLMQVEASYTDSPNNTIHLLSHIYVSRSEALWKDSDLIAWFEAQISQAFPTIDSKESSESRSDALAIIQSFITEGISVPMRICRHVLCSESTSWLGFLPPKIKNAPFHAFDPLPPDTMISSYDAEYFNGVQPSRRQRNRRGPGGRMGEEEGMAAMGQRLAAVLGGGTEGWQDRLRGFMGDLVRERGGQMPQDGPEMNDLIQMMEGAMQGGGGGGGEGMPGGFPGAEEQD